MGRMKTILLSLCTVALVISQATWAGENERNQAKRIHDRLTGVNATNDAINDMHDLLMDDLSGKSAAEYAIDTTRNPNARYFLQRHIKEFRRALDQRRANRFHPVK